MTEASFMRLDGPFRIVKAEGQVRRRRSHPSLAAAEAEARRLATVQPGDAFVVMQEVAYVGHARTLPK